MMEVRALFLGGRHELENNQHAVALKVKATCRHTQTHAVLGREADSKIHSKTRLSAHTHHHSNKCLYFE